MAAHARLARPALKQLGSTSFAANRSVAQARCLSSGLARWKQTDRLSKSQRSAPTYALKSLHVRHASNATATAPNARAYINSGVISGAQDLVDVKKVLVIGSGGLSIGQAGEFDYSGTIA